MKNIIKFTFVLAILALFTPQPAEAVRFNPQKINKFGVHLGDTNHLQQAAELVNSNKGDWGWITVVIRSNELNKQQWQNFFNQSRRLHLNPIVRLATKTSGKHWKRPNQTEIKQMAEFLNQLIWPTKNKFIIAFNEPNHGNEWGGGVDVKNYADIFLFTQKAFKKLENNFFVLFAGPDQAAPHKPPNYFSAKEFYRQIYLYKPEIFKNIDGLASHSYPNHGFVGLPSDQGWASIRGYQSELLLLKKFGAKDNLPVFITETGWPHQEGVIKKTKFYPEQKLGKLFQEAFKIWNNDEKVYAFTPFILYFPQGNFSNFAWLDENKQPYSFYQDVQKIEKQSWWPEQDDAGAIIKSKLPPIIFPNHLYQGSAIVQNNGQQIWGEKGRVCWPAINSELIELTDLCQKNNQNLEPQQVGVFTFSFKIKTGKPINKRAFKLTWENLNPINIKPILKTKTFTVYRPKTSLLKKITTSWYNLRQQIKTMLKLK